MPSEPAALRGGHALDGFQDLPAAAQTLVAATIVLGAASFGYILPELRFARLGLFVELLVLALITSTVKVSLPLARSTSTMSLSFAINLAALVLLGTAEAVVTGMLSAWAQCWLRTKGPRAVHRTLFSVASVGLALHAAGLVYAATQGADATFTHRVLLPLLSATTVYFFVNTFLIAAAVALSTREAVWAMWLDSFLWSAPGYFVAAGAAAVSAQVASRGSAWLLLLVAIPVYLTFRSYRVFIARIDEERTRNRELRETQLATIEALVLAIEVKDRTSHAQLRRMQVYADGLARAMGMPEAEIPGVRTAALLHDIGHLAVPEHMLSKAGPLSYEEFERVKIHPRVGADILAPVPFPYPVAPLILAHHERWDGSGYPEGLSGTAIPLGARVLAVADAFTSLLFDRPYRQACSYSEAVATLRSCADVSLDPVAVETFIEILPGLEVQLQGQADPHEISQAEMDFSPMGPMAFDNIAGAHREARVLYEIAQALGTSLGVEETVVLVGEKLQGLLPFSCCALFLADPATGHLRCRVASGRGEREVADTVALSVEALATSLPVNAVTGEVPLQSVLAFPLIVGVHTIGAFAIYDELPASYDGEHRRILDLVTRQASPIIQNALVFEDAQEASLTDSLTGLANRRALQQHLTRELARAERQRARVTVLWLDMDGLKYLNDHFGHHVGDRAIREVATVLRPLLRSYDLCARLAGDEFVVTLWECDAGQAVARCEELQQIVATSAIDVGRGKTVTLGISAGAATFPEDGRTVEELLNVADQRMYANKTTRQGTGRLLLPSREPEPGPIRVAG